MARLVYGAKTQLEVLIKWVRSSGVNEYSIREGWFLKISTCCLFYSNGTYLRFVAGSG